jgi:hypothetical protein
LPADPKLEAEIHFGEWQSVQIGAAMDRRTVWKAPRADDYRERLKRSPDRLSSVQLATYLPDGANRRLDERPAWRDEANAEPNPFDVHAASFEGGYDPFNPWGDP